MRNPNDTSAGPNEVNVVTFNTHLSQQLALVSNPAHLLPAVTLTPLIHGMKVGGRVMMGPETPGRL